MTPIRRRDLLAGTALVLLDSRLAPGSVVAGQLPWRPDAGDPPQPVAAGPWQFFTANEAAMVEVIADRIIPADPQTPGGKDSGCAVFIDRQLAGPYGRREGLYTQGPFTQGMKEQGPQSTLSPAELYRKGLAALDLHCRSAGGANGSPGKSLPELTAGEQDAILHDLESGRLALQGVDGKTFFAAVLQDVQYGFFADPIYGGNRDMCAWKMIGFPGARYDYRDWVSRHNERYPHPPVSIAGRPEWTPKSS
jgi:gluconate 2-dehydrogenase gamma chain